VNPSEHVAKQLKEGPEEKVMERKFGFRATWVLVAACFVAAGLATLERTSRAEEKPRLAGQWTFNQDQSDDANEKIREAQANARAQSGGYPGEDEGYPGGGGGYPRGGGVGFPGGRGGIGGGPMGGGRIGRGGQRGGAAGQGAGLVGEDMEQLAANPKMLRVEQDEKVVTVTDDRGQSRNLYPDGKKHKESDASGHSVSIKARWQENRLVAESKLGHSGKLTETYELGPDGRQLIVISQLENSQLRAPLRIRRVYDLASKNAK
jgi:hypothetical protein